MSMSGHAPAAGTAERYRAFVTEARGRSPQYEELTAGVAGDHLILEFLDALPTAKRQPNLLFAAACYLLGAPADLRALRWLVSDRGGELARTMLARRTQTNEPARCATLLPALALLPQPLALIEVGASAGLTLLADRYSYDYGSRQLTGTDPDAPVLSCRPLGLVPIPTQVPDVAWRAGLDLNPLDVTDDDDVRWLECLVWPGETDPARIKVLRQSLERTPMIATKTFVITKTFRAYGTNFLHQEKVLTIMAMRRADRSNPTSRELGDASRAPLLRGAAAEVLGDRQRQGRRLGGRRPACVGRHRSTSTSTSGTGTGGT
jgi:hypothetical protein